MVAVPRPIPTLILHMTRIERLASIVTHGLLPESECRRRQVAGIEIGYPHIKDRRAQTPVPCGPRGTLADYVPFYFAPRSPMLYAIGSGQLSDEASRTERIIYLVSTTERVDQSGLSRVISDRHPALAYARFTDQDQDLQDDSFVDWQLMFQTYWNNTPDEPDRKERRQAEYLVHPHVPWSLFDRIVTKTEEMAIEVRAVLGSLDTQAAIYVRRGWYF